MLFVAHERASIVEDPYVKGPPDPVIEVTSHTTSRRDRHARRQRYARYGVTYDWIIDPSGRRVEALALEGSSSEPGHDYRSVARGRDDETFSAPQFPELAIPLGDPWKR